MRHLTKEEREALFPTTCHFKVITISLEGIHLLLNQALELNGISDRKFQPSAQSKNGKYTSYEIALELETHEIMMRLDREFRSIDGVKMVLEKKNRLLVREAGHELKMQDLKRRT